MQRKTPIALTTALGLLLGGGSALADGQVGTAAACNPKKGDASKLNYTTAGRLENTSSSPATIYCPIDFTYDFGVQEPSAADIAYKASHPSQPLTCTGYGIYWWGGIANMETQMDTNNAGTFDFESRTAYDMGASFYSVTCTLPPVSNGARSWIASFLHGINPL